MDKNIIYEYMDAKALVKETEEDIRRHRRKTIVQDKVTGSNPEFPYQPQSFNISGCIENTVNIDEEERLLEERKLNAKQIKVKAERVINKAPVRMQRIIRFKVMQGLTWGKELLLLHAALVRDWIDGTDGSTDYCIPDWG